MRILKEPEERRNEILDTAERLFLTKGYSQTTILDILNGIGIAKGTFYYYFKSKEDVMDAIIQRTLIRKVERAKQIIADANIPTKDKLFAILMDPNPEKEQEAGLAEQFHQPGNAEMHQKSMIQLIRFLSPVLAEVVRQGIEEKIFFTEYPQECVEILLSSSSVLFDEGLFQWPEEEKIKKARAYIHSMEQILGAEKGCFDNIMQLIVK